MFSDSSLSSRSLDPQRGPCWPNQRTLNFIVSNYLAYHLHSSYWNPRLFYLLFSCFFSVFHWVQASWGLFPFPPLGIQNLRHSQAHSGCLTITICWQIDPIISLISRAPHVLAFMLECQLEHLIFIEGYLSGTVLNVFLLLSHAILPINVPEPMSSYYFYPYSTDEGIGHRATKLLPNCLPGPVLGSPGHWSGSDSKSMTVGNAGATAATLQGLAFEPLSVDCTGAQYHHDQAHLWLWLLIWAGASLPYVYSTWNITLLNLVKKLDSTGNYI